MDEVKRILQIVSEINGRLNAEHTENQRVFQQFREEMLHAFPDNDLEGHRKFHDELIVEAIERRRFYRELRGKLLERGIWAVLAMVATAVWFYLTKGPK